MYYYGHGGGWFIFILIVWIAVQAISALQFGAIAEMKGHKSSTYFWFSFLFGPAGWVMVAALPDRADKQDQAQNFNSNELPYL